MLLGIINDSFTSYGVYPIPQAIVIVIRLEVATASILSATS